MKKILARVLALCLLASVGAVALAEETIALTVWVGSDQDQPWIDQVIENFKAANPDKSFDIRTGIVSEGDAKGSIIKDVEAAADVFTFAHDQINELHNAGALQQVMIDTDLIIEENGGADAPIVKACTVDGALYAYPATADNGYFMFYNKAFLTEEDVKSLDKILEVAATNGKFFSMDSTAWYIYSFFKGAGLDVTLNEDRLTNSCNWNAVDTPIKGVDVAQAMLDIAANPGYTKQSDAEFQAGIKDGSVIAGINGVWNANVAKEAWGENYAAVKLPSYTVAGQQVQMGSFAGFKLVGVNAYSKQVGYAMMFAEFMTNYDSQMSRFAMRNQGPSNVKAAASDEVQADPAIAALSQQAANAEAQNVGGNYWAPADTLGSILTQGNPDGTDLQELLDTAVIGITAPVN